MLAQKNGSTEADRLAFLIVRPETDLKLETDQKKKTKVRLIQNHASIVSSKIFLGQQLCKTICLQKANTMYTKIITF